jgi:hypothetical protein
MLKVPPLSFANKEGCVILFALPFALQSILRQKKKNYGNSTISPCKNIITDDTLPRQAFLLPHQLHKVSFLAFNVAKLQATILF